MNRLLRSESTSRRMVAGKEEEGFNALQRQLDILREIPYYETRRLEAEERLRREAAYAAAHNGSLTDICVCDEPVLVEEEAVVVPPRPPSSGTARSSRYKSSVRSAKYSQRTCRSSRNDALAFVFSGADAVVDLGAPLFRLTSKHDSTVWNLKFPQITDLFSPSTHPPSPTPSVELPIEINAGPLLEKEGTLRAHIEKVFADSMSYAQTWHRLETAEAIFRSHITEQGLSSAGDVAASMAPPPLTVLHQAEHAERDKIYSEAIAVTSRVLRLGLGRYKEAIYEGYWGRGVGIAVIARQNAVNRVMLRRLIREMLDKVVEKWEAATAAITSEEATAWASLTQGCFEASERRLTASMAAAYHSLTSDYYVGLVPIVSNLHGSLITAQLRATPHPHASGPLTFELRVGAEILTRAETRSRNDIANEEAKAYLSVCAVDCQAAYDAIRHRKYVAELCSELGISVAS